ncbi:hypothetical protein Syun_014966 [Stephania yunnanensis]|uniref:Uncharacterized protein n=1 Tax=Stephania yunnanensis TaxID=152371 RepID=A0AAP0JKA9_9MAGN
MGERVGDVPSDLLSDFGVLDVPAQVLGSIVDTLQSRETHVVGAPTPLPMGVIRSRELFYTASVAELNSTPP